MIIQEPVQAAIWHALNHYAYKDAVFLAERLYAEVGTDEALYLLATSYYRAGKTYSAYSMLNTKGSQMPQCRFLLAKCCMDLNKYSEAEIALTGNTIAKSKNIDDLVGEFGESASFAIQILGDIYSRNERHAKGVEAFRKSLTINPFLWTSYESLVNLGEKPDPTKIFVISELENFNLCQGYNPVLSLINKENNCKLNSENVDTSSHANKTSYFSLHNSPAMALLKCSPQELEVVTPENCCHFQPLARSSSHASFGKTRNIARSMFISNNVYYSPSFGVLPLESTPLSLTPSLQESSPHDSIPGLHARRNTKFQIFGVSNNASSQPTPTNLASSENLGVNLSVRRSSRLFSSGNSVKENNKGSSNRGRNLAKRTKSLRPAKTAFAESELNEINTAASHPLPSATGNPPPSKPISQPINLAQTALSMQKASAEGLMQLLQELGKARCYVGHYSCKRAIELINNLPPHHHKTGWVLTLLGRAHFELGEYQQAKEAFEQVRLLEPYRLEGMEYYSTTLWHLQQEVALSALASEFMETNKEDPQTWCFAGNCFSLQKEHETAVKFLQRAVQVAPNFAYAYTLLGHELVLTEELDRAMACFRNAVRLDARHYNAWYGIGMIYYKQEKYQLAEMHFKKAHLINPSNSILLCHIGVVQQALKKMDQALTTLNKALSMNPRNPLCKFHRATVYFHLERYQDALHELHELKEIVPRESLVYFLIGKVHKKLNNTHLALMNFSWAMDLDPKGSNNQIKEAIDRQYSAAEDEDTSLPPAATTTPAETSSEPSTGVVAMDSSPSVSLPLPPSASVPSLPPPPPPPRSSILEMEELAPHPMESDESF